MSGPLNADAIRAGAAGAGAGAGYQIDQSIRFNDNDSAYLSRTPSSAGSRRTFTFSAWVKRSEIGTGASNRNSIFGSGDTATTNGIIFKFQDDKLDFICLGGSTSRVTSSAVYRDASAWYHCVLSVDTTQATASNRVKMYVNGEQITSFTNETYPAQNTDLDINTSSYAMRLGAESDASVITYYFDGYMAEANFVDGQQLAATDFGETNDDGVWIPKAYEGTYGTNGFYITGADSADLGADESGNSNDFTATGLTSADQRGDTPTANQSVFNLLDQNGTSNIGAFSDGSLTLATSSNDSLAATSIPVIESGCYWEAKIDSAGDEMFGLWVSSTKPLRSASTSSPHTDAASCVIRVATNTVYNEGSGSSFSPATISTNDVVMFAYKNGQFFYGKNGAWENSGDPVAETGELFTITSSSSKVIVPVFGRSGGSNVTYTLHMSEEDFTYTAPTGYVALSTANLPAPTIKDGSAYFQTTLYTGNGTTNEINQIGNSTFQPDFVWAKSRSSAQSHRLADAIRGSAVLFSDLTAAEDTTAGISFDADGFSWTNNDGSNANDSGVTYAAWQWLAGNGTVSNTDGSITSTVSANTTAGFSIVGYTGNATSGATVGHGLGLAPDVIIVKNRDASDAWQVYHSGVASDAETDYLVLNTNAAVADNVDRWNDTAPTSSVFSLGNAVEVNTNTEDYIAYCFAEVDGFSKFGSYTGNGSADGPFIWCGFRPAWVMTKRTNSTSAWTIFDNQREGYNVDNDELVANTTAAETTTNYLDLLSNGFKLRSTDADLNASGSTYIYMAFAEHPFGGDGVAPAPAR